MSTAIVDQKVLHERLVAVREAMRTRFTDALEDLSEGDLLDRLALTVQSTGRGEWYDDVVDFMAVREWLGERQYSALKAFTQYVPNRDWEVTLVVDRNDILDGNLEVYRRKIDRMVELFAAHRRELLADLINFGFDATRDGEPNTAFDGKPFFATDHPIYSIDGNDRNKYVVSGTFSNTTTAKLTPDYQGAQTLQQAITAMRKFRAPNGRRARVRPDVLVVPVELEWVARELMESPYLIHGTQMVPNPVRGTLEVIVEPELQNPNGWYLFDTTKLSLKPFIYQERQRPRFDAFDNIEGNLHLFMHKQFLFGADARYAIAYGLPMLAYGSDGSAP